MQSQVTRARVIIADDEKELRDLIRGILLADPYDITEARDGEEAVRLVNASDVDIVISDIMMPRRDGFSLCRYIKETPATAHVPVILMSGIHDLRVIITALDAGADHVITKPFQKADVLARVRNCLRTKRLFDQLLASQVQNPASCAG